MPTGPDIQYRLISKLAASSLDRFNGSYAACALAAG